MFYTVIKLDEISRVFSNVRRVLSQYKPWLSLLYLLYDIDLYAKSKLKTKHARAIKQAFFSQSERALDCNYIIYSDKIGFFSQSERALDCIYVIT
jgi:hypothetical protein